MQKLGSVLQQLYQLGGLLGISSEAGAAVLKAVNSLSKFVQPGQASPAGNANHLQDAQMQNLKQQQMMQQMMQMRQGGGGAGGGPAAPPPMPGM